MIFILIIWNSWARADLYEKAAQTMIRAQSTAQIKKIVQKIGHAQLARRACRVEIENGWVPVSCFETLQLESEFGLHSAKSQRDIGIRLNQICKKANAALRVQNNIDVRTLPPPCREATIQALKIQTYRARSLGPVFESQSLDVVSPD